MNQEKNIKFEIEVPASTRTQETKDAGELIRDFQDRLYLNHSSPNTALPDTPEVKAYMEKLNNPPERKIKTWTAQEIYDAAKCRINEMLIQKLKTGSSFQINEPLMTISSYLAGDNSNIDISKGLLLKGGIGIGKTFLMKALAAGSIVDPLPEQALPHQWNTKNFISCIAIQHQFARDGYNSIERYCILNGDRAIQSVFVFDDFGAENVSATNYGNKINVMEIIMMARYELFQNNGIKTHITTNLVDSNQIEVLYSKRVRSRMREMFNSIEFTGQDLRK